MSRKDEMAGHGGGEAREHIFPELAGPGSGCNHGGLEAGMSGGAVTGCAGGASEAGRL